MLMAGNTDVTGLVAGMEQENKDPLCKCASYSCSLHGLTVLVLKHVSFPNLPGIKFELNLILCYEL